MAITPTDLFSPQQSIVGRMLAGGSAVFADAIQSAVRSAAGLADNQVRQERDFLMERQNEEKMLQRRAENAQQQINADRLFNFNAARDARDFGFREDQAEAMDADRDRAFNQSVKSSDAAAKAREAELGLSRERLGLAKDEFELKKDDLAREREFNESIVAPTYGPKLPGQEPTPEELFAVADAKQQAAENTRNGPAFMEATREKAEAKRKMEAEGKTDKPLSATELRMQRAEERRLQTDAEKALEKEAKELVADTDAFAPQTQFVPIDPATQKYEAKAYDKAQAWDKDRFTSEKLAAQGVTKEEFVKKGQPTDPNAPKLTDLQRKRRERFWELVNGKASAPAASSSASADWLKKNLVE